MKSWGSNRCTSNGTLGIQLLMFLTLTSACCCGELASLDLRASQCHPGGISFQKTSGTRTARIPNSLERFLPWWPRTLPCKHPRGVQSRDSGAERKLHSARHGLPESSQATQAGEPLHTFPLAYSNLATSSLWPQKQEGPDCKNHWISPHSLYLWESLHWMRSYKQPNARAAMFYQL